MERNKLNYAYQSTPLKLSPDVPKNFNSSFMESPLMKDQIFNVKNNLPDTPDKKNVSELAYRMDFLRPRVTIPLIQRYIQVINDNYEKVSLDTLKNYFMDLFVIHQLKFKELTPVQFYVLLKTKANLRLPAEEFINVFQYLRKKYTSVSPPMDPLKQTVTKVTKQDYLNKIFRVPDANRAKILHKELRRRFYAGKSGSPEEVRRVGAKFPSREKTYLGVLRSEPYAKAINQLNSRQIGRARAQARYQEALLQDRLNANIIVGRARPINDPAGGARGGQAALPAAQRQGAQGANARPGPQVDAANNPRPIQDDEFIDIFADFAEADDIFPGQAQNYIQRRRYRILNPDEQVENLRQAVDRWDLADQQGKIVEGTVFG